MLYDIHKKEWNKDLMAFAKIDESIFPDVMAMGTDIGALDTDVAAEVGITGDCRIILGGQDQKLAAIGKMSNGN